MQIGYACGYTTAFMGKSILYREVECRSQGREHCRIVGKPASEWKHAEEDLKYLQFGKIETLHVPGQPAAAPPEPAPKVGNGGGPAIPPAIPKPGRGKIVGASTGYVVARHKLERVAATKATVLFSGETGVGKERFARLLHDLSPRRAKPFIAMNCAAIPYDLVESELFGVVKGAYTGAIQDRPGRFERADGGTLFLDEIGALPYAAQAKLLRALQEKEIERLGGVTVHKVDVRIAAATNVDLEVEMRAGRFRADLYHRLNVFPIVLPSLKERRDDIPLLLEHFLQIFCAEHNKLVTGFTGQAMDVLLSYDYPGNIRELENLVERAVILVDDGCPIDRYHLLESGHMLRDLVVRLSREGRMTQAARGDGANGATRANGGEMAPCDSLSQSILESGVSFPSLEQTLLKAAVSRAGGNLSEAARAMGISRAQLAYRLEKRVVNGLGGGKNAN
jgi:transcriptional regulator with GAF, ATPase, and Fis domain